jgi:hypothetical protein
MIYFLNHPGNLPLSLVDSHFHLENPQLYYMKGASLWITFLFHFHPANALMTQLRYLDDMFCLWQGSQLFPQPPNLQRIMLGSQSWEIKFTWQVSETHLKYSHCCEMHTDFFVALSWITQSHYQWGSYYLIHNHYYNSEIGKYHHSSQWNQIVYMTLFSMLPQVKVCINYFYVR